MSQEVDYAYTCFDPAIINDAFDVDIEELCFSLSADVCEESLSVLFEYGGETLLDESFTDLDDFEYCVDSSSSAGCEVMYNIKIEKQHDVHT